MEIPILDKEETQKLASEQWVGLLLGSVGFIAQKLGPEETKEFTSEGAKNTANSLRAKGIDNPKSFAINDAVKWKNVYGSDIEVEEEGNNAVINHKKCACLAVAMELAEKGIPVTKEQHCGGCVAYYKNVLKDLGMELEPKLTEEGCEFKILKE